MCLLLLSSSPPIHSPIPSPLSLPPSPPPPPSRVYWNSCTVPKRLQEKEAPRGTENEEERDLIKDLKRHGRLAAAWYREWGALICDRDVVMYAVATGLGFMG